MTAAPAPAPELTKAQIRVIVFGVLLSIVLGTLSQTAVAPALPTMARDLGVSNASWVVSAYLIAGTASTPLFGKFADIKGRRLALLTALALFIVGSIACALAPTMPLLVAARIVQGAGGGALFVLAMVIVADVVAPRDRGRYQPYMTTTFVVGAVAGPATGGVIAQYSHWSMIFWLCAALGVCAILFSSRVLKGLPRREQPHRLDWWGGALLLLASTTLMGAISQDGGVVTTLILVLASCLAWLAFGWRSVTAEEPLIPLPILKSPLVLSGTVAALFGAGALIVLTTFLPAFFQSVLGLSVAQAGFALIPMLVGSALGSVAAGQVMTWRPRYRWVAEVSLLASAAATAVLALFGDRLSLWPVEGLLLLASLGAGAITPVTTFSIQNSVAFHELGIATSTNNFVRQLGAALMVAGVGTLVLHVGPGRAAEQTMAFHGLFWAMTGAFFLAYLALLFMEERPLRSGAR